jgi:hypothetical protein
LLRAAVGGHAGARVGNRAIGDENGMINGRAARRVGGQADQPNPASGHVLNPARA